MQAVYLGEITLPVVGVPATPHPSGRRGRQPVAVNLISSPHAHKQTGILAACSTDQHSTPPAGDSARRGRVYVRYRRTALPRPDIRHQREQCRPFAPTGGRGGTGAGREIYAPHGLWGVRRGAADGLRESANRDTASLA